ncbi:MAG: hypothetical protein KDC87_01460 [Planctomycetes bacterium]|nr:hypothetical protein [Planctomycetota bacterium]
MREEIRTPPRNVPACATDRLESLVDGTGILEERAGTIRRLLRNPHDRARLWDLIVADQVVSSRGRRRQRLLTAAGLLAAAAVLVAFWPWPARRTIHLLGASEGMVGGVCHITLAEGDGLRVDPLRFPAGTRVSWIARSFDGSWRKELRTAASSTVPADQLLGGPGARLVLVTTRDPVEVDRMLDAWRLPADLDALGVQGATNAVAAALRQQPPPAVGIIAVCGYAETVLRALEALLVAHASLLADRVDARALARQIRDIRSGNLLPMWACTYGDGVVVYNRFRFYRDRSKVTAYFVGRPDSHDRDAYYVLAGERVAWDTRQAAEFAAAHGGIVRIAPVE